MVGVLTAYFLNRKGVEYTVIDAGPIAGSVTRNTTAKITSQHGLIYSRLTTSHGKTRARQYARANEQAIAAFREMVRSLEIDCDFEDVTATLYAVRDEKLIENEYRAARTSGIETKLKSDTGLPFPVKAAVEFSGQAQFNPIKFINRLAKDLDIYTGTRALEIKNRDGGGGRDKIVTTDKGVIYAKKVVIATHYPFINRPGYYFLRMHQDRSYVLALEGAGALDSCYLGVDGGKYSFRSYQDKIIMGGCSHRTGENKSGGKFENLTKASERFFPGSRVYCRWSAQDCMTGDDIPYIGKFSQKTDGMYVATGFKKWGMTSSMISAMILSDMITGKKPEFDIFSPSRLNHGMSLKSFFMDASKSAAGLGKSMFQVPDKRASSIKAGAGDIVELSGEKVGLFRDTHGNSLLVDAKCSHMGCQLTWNADEMTWDCLCHGSRFDTQGKVISGPAQTGIKKDQTDIKYKE